MRRREVRATAAAFLGVMLVPGCASPAGTPAAGYAAWDRLAKGLVGALPVVLSRAGAGAARSESLAALSGIPAAVAVAIPLARTGGVDPAATVEGTASTIAADVDADGVVESLSVLATAAGAGFVAWRGDAASGDDGDCYVAWPDAPGAWFLAARCGDPGTVAACRANASGAACVVCGAAGCGPCDAQGCEPPEAPEAVDVPAVQDADATEAVDVPARSGG
jgi:hypothetical protein